MRSLTSALKRDDQFLQVVGVELRVLDVRVITLVLEGVDDDFKRLMVFVRRAFARP